MAEKHSLCNHPNKFMCFACQNGGCAVLEDGIFFDKNCPFFKTKKDIMIEKINTYWHLIEIGYMNPYELQKEEREMYCLTKSEETYCKLNHIDCSGVLVIND